MDIHEIALRVYTSLVARMDIASAGDESRAELGREAYRCADAFVAAKDTYIRELPLADLDPTDF